MKKRIVAAALSLMLVSGLAGCGVKEQAQQVAQGVAGKAGSIAGVVAEQAQIALHKLPFGIGRAEAKVLTPDQTDKVRVAKFWINKKYYEIDGQRYEMDVAPYVKNNRTIMPVRYVAYALGIPEEDIMYARNDQEDNEMVEIERHAKETYTLKTKYDPRYDTSADVTHGLDYFKILFDNKKYLFMEMAGYPSVVNLDVLPEIIPPAAPCCPSGP